jgi:hypothetical protein
LKKGFGRIMNDYDLRPVEMIALYHPKYQSPELEKRTGPSHWNFLEMNFDPRGDDTSFTLKVRNIIDPPDAEPRGGGFVDDHASNTGRPETCSLPEVRTLSDADVLFSTIDGRPIRGARSDSQGRVPVSGLVDIDGEDIEPGTKVIMTAYDGEDVDSQVLTAGAVDVGKLESFRTEIGKLKIEAKKEYDGWVAEHKQKQESGKGGKKKTRR